MEYCTVLVLYVGKIFGLEYNNDLMICCVYIIYTIVIRDNTYIMKIIIVFLCTMMVIAEGQSVVIIKLRK